LQAELSSLGDPRLAGELARRGYVLTGFENVLGMALHESVAARAESAATSIEIRTSNTVDERTWIDVVVAGFAHPDEFDGPASHESFSNESLQRVMTAVARTEGLQRYLALRDDRPAGGASLRLCDGIALLCGSATLPEHRRRGVQTALVQRRLADAARAGCDVAVVTTQPGSKSQENAQRRGFELLYTRAILVRAPG
jgi:GNAT superfamily N-acetyltransferase